MNGGWTSHRANIDVGGVSGVLCYALLILHTKIGHKYANYDDEK